MNLFFKVCGLVFTLTLLILLSLYDKHHGTGGYRTGGDHEGTYVGNNPNNPDDPE